MQDPFNISNFEPPGHSTTINQDNRRNVKFHDPNQYCPCPPFVQQGNVQRLDASVGSMRLPGRTNANNGCMVACTSCDECETNVHNLNAQGSGGIQTELSQLEAAERKQLVDQLLQWQNLRRKILTNAIGQQPGPNA